MRADSMNPPEEDNRAPEESDDLDEGLEPAFIPSDADVQEGDEEKDEGTRLPPAMPPGV